MAGQPFADPPARDVWRWVVPHVIADDEIYIAVLWLWEVEISGSP